MQNSIIFFFSCHRNLRQPSFRLDDFSNGFVAGAFHFQVNQHWNCLLSFARKTTITFVGRSDGLAFGSIKPRNVYVLWWNKTQNSRCWEQNSTDRLECMCPGFFHLTFFLTFALSLWPIESMVFDNNWANALDAPFLLSTLPLFIHIPETSRNTIKFHRNISR